MFKSVFAKHFISISLTLTVSFLALLLTVSAIMGVKAGQARQAQVASAADAAFLYVDEQFSTSPSGELTTLIALRGEEIGSALSLMVSHEKELAVAIVTDSGRVLLTRTGTAADALRESTLPEGLLKEAMGNGGGLISQDVDHYSLFDAPQILYAMPLMTGDGTVAGTLLVWASDQAPALLTSLAKAIFPSILWILLAALIAAYLITERLLAPLRAIRDAAKRFAEGDFEVCLPVRGNDEIAELSLALNSMARTMQNYDTMRNTFLSNVSHELRTPMTSISGFIDGILDGVIPADKHPYYLRLVSGEIRRLSRLVATLLDLSRIQAGDRKFTPAPFDVCEMGRQILISFEQKINEKRLEVSFDCEEESLTALADGDAVYQVLYNLCDNAVKFAAEGGALRIAIKRVKSHKLQVSVYNQGQGIADADLPYVFERFYKSDKSRGLNKSGMGLGLFISKTIIDAHGERIWVESEQGESCCFQFTLPCE